MALKPKGLLGLIKPEVKEKVIADSSPISIPNARDNPRIGLRATRSVEEELLHQFDKSILSKYRELFRQEIISNGKYAKEFLEVWKSNSERLKEYKRKNSVDASRRFNGSGPYRATNLAVTDTLNYIVTSEDVRKTIQDYFSRKTLIIFDGEDIRFKDYMKDMERRALHGEKPEQYFPHQGYVEIKNEIDVKGLSKEDAINALTNPSRGNEKLLDSILDEKLDREIILKVDELELRKLIFESDGNMRNIEVSRIKARIIPETYGLFRQLAHQAQKNDYRQGIGKYFDFTKEEDRMKFLYMTCTFDNGSRLFLDSAHREQKDNSRRRLLHAYDSLSFYSSRFKDFVSSFFG